VTNWVILIVLMAALMHAIWNSLISHASNKSMFTMALHVCSSLMAIPLLWAVGLPSEASYPYLLSSVLLHGVYIYVLTKVYTHSAFGSAYIVMRGMAPFFVMLISLLTLGESFAAPAISGLVCLSLGILLLLRTYATPQAPLTGMFKGSHLQFALLNAAVIAAYTVVDGAGARLSGNPTAYVLASAVFEPILVYLMAYRRQTQELWQFSKHNAGLIVLGSAISITGYSMVLWAMTVSPIALVSALRETSVVFAMLISIFWFKEGRFGPAATSSILVLVGVYLLKA
jgi:drug/metabolite transporter (DMT)-like permease